MYVSIYIYYTVRKNESNQIMMKSQEREKDAPNILIDYIASPKDVSAFWLTTLSVPLILQTPLLSLSEPDHAYKILLSLEQRQQPWKQSKIPAYTRITHVKHASCKHNESCLSIWEDSSEWGMQKDNAAKFANACSVWLWWLLGNPFVELVETGTLGHHAFKTLTMSIAVYKICREVGPCSNSNISTWMSNANE